mmetsp:Transcript_14126/g.42637  ORF Transcript_14126/g.42637 Transcript_14126/m.42637 type:complete len:847 (+) Transcript_14126:158-2698(+)
MGDQPGGSPPALDADGGGAAFAADFPPPSTSSVDASGAESSMPANGSSQRVAGDDAENADALAASQAASLAEGDTASDSGSDDGGGNPAASQLPLSFHAQALVPDSDGESDDAPQPAAFEHSSAESSPREYQPPPRPAPAAAPVDGASSGAGGSQLAPGSASFAAFPSPTSGAPASAAAASAGGAADAAGRGPTASASSASGASAPSAALSTAPAAVQRQTVAPSADRPRTLGVDEEVVSGLMEELGSGSAELQQVATEQIRDLMQARAGYREALVALGGLPALVALLDAPEKPVTLHVAQALGYIATTPSCRTAVRQGQAVGLLVGTLIHGQERVGEPLREAILQALAAVAADDPGRLAVHEAGGVPLLIKLMDDGSPNALSTRFATELVGQLAHADELKTAIRDAGGLLALVRHLKAEGQREEALETVTRALTVLVINNRTNQDYIRTIDGVKPLVRLLEMGATAPGVVAAALDALRAATMNNEDNKAAAAASWLVPQLVKLIGSEEKNETVEKAVDCLRIVTTGNDVNKRALVDIPIALPALIRLLEQPQKVVCERAVAVVGNLSTSSEYFGALREAGVLGRLVALLNGGTSSRVTEIAAKSLANLGSAPTNKTTIRLAGGIPPLVALLMEQPSPQVAHAAEQALRQLEVSMSERNAIMMAFKYKEARMSAAVEAAIARADAVVEAASAEVVDPGTKPFTRYTAKEVAQLMRELGFPDQAAAKFLEDAVNGGDTLQLTPDDLLGDMGLSKLQAKKIKGLQAAFKTFNLAMRTPGKGELTMAELREFLSRAGLVERSVLTVLGGLKEVLGNDTLATLTFKDFLLVWAWLTSTIEAMGASLPTSR